MNIADFDYDLPESFIAQQPVEPRDSAKLMVLDRQQKTISHHVFRDILDYFNPGDVLVVNNTRVIPARLHGFIQETGGKVEILLLRRVDTQHWRVLVGGKRAPVGTGIRFAEITLTAQVIKDCGEAERIVQFSDQIEPFLPDLGDIPLPPYITHILQDTERYQTIYSKPEGSAAAPTAGLHFTPELLIALRDKGVSLANCTLHIGLDTFQPVKVQDITQHHIHSEYATLTADDAHIINEAKLSGGRVIAVGTTTARTLETAAILSAGGDPADPASLGDVCPWRPVTAFSADTSLYIYPGYQWRVVDALITNFHLPKSTLLMMISSFAGREFVLRAYEEAKSSGYRFFSFGDAMFIL